MQTYNEWLQQGRVVMTGAHADHYRVNADRSKGFALFRSDQTIPLGDRIEEAECRDIIPAEEWRQIKTARRRVERPLAKVRKDPDGYWIWCGNNKTVIEHLKKNHWKFDRASHRWHASILAANITVEKLVAALEKLGCRVEVEGDA